MRKVISFSAFWAIVLTGCISFDTTTFPDKITTKPDKVCTLEIKGFDSGKSFVVGYPQEEMIGLSKETLQEFIKRRLENVGFRCRGDEMANLSPTESAFRVQDVNVTLSAQNRATLVLIGDMSGNIYTDWSHGLTDTLINIPGGLCLFSFWSVRQKCDATMRVYSSNGDFLKEYHSTLSYNSKVVGFILSAIGDLDQNPFVIESRLKCGLAIDLLEQFCRDLSAGTYNTWLK